MMKALIVHSDLSQCGGAEDYSNAVKMALEAQGWKTAVLDVNGLSEGGRKIEDGLILKLARNVYPFKHFSLLKYAVVCRFMRSLEQDYDLVVFSYGEGPEIGGKTMRIMHAPGLFSTSTEMLSYLGVDSSNWFALFGRKLYAWVCRIIADPSTEDTPNTITITNSRWTSQVVSRVWGVNDTTVLYPKVSLNPHAEAANQNKVPFSFIALGRIVPNKRLEDAIAIIDQLRSKGYDCKLDIVGRCNTPYARHLVESHKNHRAVAFYPDASEEEKTALIAKAQFGLHCYRNEHFGIAVAEMLLLGCIPVVFDGGGVTELVEDDRQKFSSLEDAVGKISLLLELSEKELQAMSSAQKSNGALVRAVNFDSEVEQLVDAVGRGLSA